MKTAVIVVVLLMTVTLAVVQAGGRSRRAAGPTLTTRFGELPIFPADNPWNRDVSELPVHRKSAAWLGSIGLETGLHPDFGGKTGDVPNGIPFCVVAGSQKKARLVSVEYAGESDAGPYPIPANAPIEGGPDATGDRHVLVIDYHHRKLYELFRAFRTPRGWKAGSAAIFDLTSNDLRPAGWTSADAAGLPIFPGLVRYDEVVEKGEVRHAVRFTVRKTQRGYILPATHWASQSSDPNLPPMGMRVRLRADYDIRSFPASVRVILRGLKRYGMILADNGGDGYITGAVDARWNADELETLKRVRIADLEVVETGPVVTDR